MFNKRRGFRREWRAASKYKNRFNDQNLTEGTLLESYQYTSGGTKPKADPKGEVQSENGSNSFGLVLPVSQSRCWARKRRLRDRASFTPSGGQLGILFVERRVLCAPGRYCRIAAARLCR
jgi:hypothetical protein